MSAIATQPTPSTVPTYGVWTEHPTLLRAAKAARDYLIHRLAGHDAAGAEAMALAALAKADRTVFGTDAASWAFHLARRLIRDAEYLLNSNLGVAGE